MSTTAVCTGQEGRIIDGRFRLVRWLGGGQQSGVYLAEVDGDAGRKATLKLIAADVPGAVTRLTGWEAAAGLSHPHLIHVLQAGRFALDSGEIVYAATEFADEVLGEILPERPLTSEETREMLGPVLDALSYLHAQGFAHGRLKPSNILVVEDKIKLSADCIPLTGSAGKSLPEREGYGAPEISRGEISPAVDIWSLGMTLVATLAQQPPAWENAISAEPVVPAMVPEPFAGIARDCLRLDSNRRCSLSEVRARLWPETAPRPPAPAPPIRVLEVLEAPETPSAPPRASGRLAVLVGGGILVVGVAVAMLVHTHQAPPPVAVAEQSPAPPASAAPPPDAESSRTPAPAAAPPSEATPAAQAPPAQPPDPAAAPQASAVPPAKPAAAPPPAPQTQAAPQNSESSVGNGEVAKRVLPDVLPKAQATIHGKVRINVRVDVSPNGDVSNAVSETPDASRYFTRLAVEAAQGWKFAPKPSASVWSLRFEFRRDGTDATANQENP